MLYRDKTNHITQKLNYNLTLPENEEKTLFFFNFNVFIRKRG